MNERHLDMIKKAIKNIETARESVDSLTSTDLFNLAIQHMNAKTLLKIAHGHLALVVAETECVDLGSALHYDKYQEAE